MIVLIFCKPFLENKMSIFEEYGAIKHINVTGASSLEFHV